VPYALTGPALHALAAGRDRLDPLTDPEVTASVREVVAAEAGVVRAHLVPGREADGIVGLVLDPAAEPAACAQRIATALAAHDTLRARLVRGLELAVLPPGTPVPGEPLFAR
jgi:hypothetical protein